MKKRLLCLLLLCSMVLSMLPVPVLAEDATVWTDSTQKPTVDSELEESAQEQSYDAPVLTENAQETADTAPEKAPAGTPWLTVILCLAAAAAIAVVIVVVCRKKKEKRA